MRQVHLVQMLFELILLSAMKICCKTGYDLSLKQQDNDHRLRRSTASVICLEDTEGQLCG